MPENDTIVPQFLKKYSSSLANKVTFLQVYCEDSSKIFSQKQELLEMLHKTTGSGGMYGFEELSETSSKLHTKLVDLDVDCEQQQNELVKGLEEQISIMNNIITKYS